MHLLVVDAVPRVVVIVGAKGHVCSHVVDNLTIGIESTPLSTSLSHPGDVAGPGESEQAVAVLRRVEAAHVVVCTSQSHQLCVRMGEQ